MTPDTKTRGHLSPPVARRQLAVGKWHAYTAAHNIPLTDDTVTEIAEAVDADPDTVLCDLIAMGVITPTRGRPRRES
ncbi:MAG: hypothetical protein QM662_02530 [Gordonia sp. (in: high G+C Gram-positive bacteria)]